MAYVMKIGLLDSQYRVLVAEARRLRTTVREVISDWLLEGENERLGYQEKYHKFMDSYDDHLIDDAALGRWEWSEEKRGKARHILPTAADKRIASKIAAANSGQANQAKVGPKRQ